MSNNKSGGDALLKGLLIGVISGAIFTLLYTPKTGKEVREDLKVKTDELPVELNGLLADLKDFYSKSLELLTSLSQEQYTKVKGALNETKKVVKDKLNAALDTSEEGNSNG
jgi:gas vesicle protein